MMNDIQQTCLPARERKLVEFSPGCARAYVIPAPHPVTALLIRDEIHRWDYELTEGSQGSPSRQYCRDEVVIPYNVNAIDLCARIDLNRTRREE
jgi:hypothetical protein